MTTKTQLIDDLLAEVREYRDVGGDAEVLDFVSRLPRLGPYNAALVLLQRPGARYVATAAEWRRRFDRQIRHGANPIMILVPFGPVHLLYDVTDTEGGDLPRSIVEPFDTLGDVTDSGLNRLVSMVNRLGIGYRETERGSTQAGELSCRRRPGTDVRWDIAVSSRLTPAAKTATIFHELGHLFAGHLGAYEGLEIGSRVEELSAADPAMPEVEAEAIAWLLCRRVGITPQSGKYVAGHLENRELPSLPLDLILSVTGRIETRLAHADELASFLRDQQLTLFRRP